MNLFIICSKGWSKLFHLTIVEALTVTFETMMLLQKSSLMKLSPTLWSICRTFIQQRILNPKLLTILVFNSARSSPIDAEARGQVTDSGPSSATASRCGFTYNNMRRLRCGKFSEKTREPKQKKRILYSKSTFIDCFLRRRKNIVASFFSLNTGSMTSKEPSPLKKWRFAQKQESWIVQNQETD